MASRWPDLLSAANEASIVTPYIMEGENGWAYGSTDSELTAIVERFYHRAPESPAMMFTHQMCWRDEPYVKAHMDGRLRFTRTDHESFPFGEHFAMRFDAQGRLPGLPLCPQFLRWHVPSGISLRQMGFVKRSVTTLVLRNGCPVSVGYSERLAVGRSRTAECRLWHRAGMPIACQGLAHSLVYDRSVPSRLSRYEPSESSTARPSILDVQTVKFTRFVPTSHHSRPFDFEKEELLFSFEREQGGLIALGVERASIINAIECPGQDWAVWLSENPQLAEVGHRRLWH